MKKFQGIEVTEGKPQIITLCGSSRFAGDMAVVGWEFEKQGSITLGLHLLPDWYCVEKEYKADENGHIHHIGEQEGVEDQMDTLHFKKIEMSDLVFVVNCGRYIGKPTAREIAYAKHLGKRIEYLEPIGDQKNAEVHCERCGFEDDLTNGLCGQCKIELDDFSDTFLWHIDYDKWERRAFKEMNE